MVRSSAASRSLLQVTGNLGLELATHEENGAQDSQKLLRKAGVESLHEALGEAAARLQEGASTFMDDSSFDALTMIFSSPNKTWKGMVDLILPYMTEMENKINDTHADSQALLDNYSMSFGICATAKSIGEEEARLLKLQMHAKSADHQTCRTKEAALKTTKDSCNAASHALETTKNISCQAYTEAVKVPDINLVPHPRADEINEKLYKTWVKRVKDWAIAELSSVDAKETQCKSDSATFSAKKDECVGNDGQGGLTKNHSDKKQECNMAQTGLESVACSYHDKAEGTCKNYGRCHNMTMTEYNLQKPVFQSSQAARQREWWMVQRIRCYLEVFSAIEHHGKVDVSKVEACKNAEHSVGHLNLTWSDLPPAPDACPAVEHPCTTAWELQEYGLVPAGAPVQTCTPCASAALGSLSVSRAGQWTLVMKIGMDSTLGYSSKYWEDDKLLDANSPVESAGNAKYAAFLNTPFKQIRMCIGAPTTNCVKHAFQKEWSNAKELFTAGYIRDATLDRDAILDVFGPKKGSYQDCPMQRPGFNIQCKGYNWARFGFCNNCASQSCQNKDKNDADASIGIGLRGQSTASEMGAGWTQYFASGAGTCRPNSMTYKKAWLWVQ